MKKYLWLLLLVMSGCTSPGKQDIFSLKWELKEGFIEHTLRVKDGYLYGSDTRHEFFKIRIADGSVAWRFKTNAPVVFQPEFAGGYVYLLDEEKGFYMLDRTGRVMWQTYIPGSPKTPPIAWQYYVFVSSNMMSTLDTSFDTTAEVEITSNMMSALDTRTKTMVWKVPLDGSAPARPLLCGNTLVAGNIENKLVSMDAATGAIHWETPCEHTSAGVADDSTVYFIEDQYRNRYEESISRYLIARDLLTGEERWSYPWVYMSYYSRSYDREHSKQYDMERLSPQEVVLDGDKLFLNCGPRIVCLDKQDGHVVWEANLPGQDEGIGGSLVLHKNHVIFRAGYRQLYSVSTGGELKLLRQLEHDENYTFLSDGHRLFAATVEGEFFEVNLN